TTWTQIHNFGIGVDRARRGQLGISLLINPSFQYTVLPLPIYQESKYILPCQCQNYLIICTYLPPAIADQTCFDLLTDALEYYAQHYDFDHILLCGDFNTRLGDFVGDKRQNSRYQLFLDFIQGHCLTLHNIEHAFGIPTYVKSTEASPIDKSSIIDFFLSTHPSDMEGISMSINTNVYLGSDHKMVYFELPHDFNLPPSPNNHPRLLWNLNKFQQSSDNPSRHLDTIRQYRNHITPLLHDFSQLMDPSILCSKPDYDHQQAYINYLNTTLIELVHSSLDATIQRHVPRPKNWKWFYTQSLADACRQRERLYKKWKNANQFNKILFWKQFQEAAENVRSQIDKSKRFYFRQFCDKLSTSEFSKASNKLKHIKRNKARPISNVFQHIDGPQAAVDSITVSWQDTYDGKYLNPAVEQIPVEYPSSASGFDTSIRFDVEDVAYAIKCLPTNKAPGFDHIKSEMLKPITDLIAPILHQFFSLCWRFATIPTDYNHAQVIPIYKKGPINDPKNHRPISLICSFRKIYEICIYNVLQPRSVTLDPVQGGFRNQRSTLDQALCLQELILRYKQKHKEFPTLLFLDIKSAYDTTDRNIIWKALRDINIDTPLLTTMQLLFNHVQIEVLLNGHVSSSPFNPTTGVLQGSTLSPHLYSIYINSLAQALRNEPTSTRSIYSQVRAPPSEMTHPHDDVVILGNARNTQALLDMAEQHSISLGYRWNPLKSAIILPPHLQS
ncbi:hypothetical protein, partial, partial [Parasitella parasitica]